MDGKTPTSVLTELSAHFKVASPQYESVADETGEKLFVSIVNAFGLVAKGSGRSKIEAKHASSQALIDCLSKNEPYKSKLGSYAPSPPKVEPDRSTRSTFQNNDAVGNLITLCQKRQINLPKFDAVSANGEAHKPLFTFSCRIANNQTLGVAATKKEAKQIAASIMLELLDDDDESYHSADMGMSSESASGNEAVQLTLPLVELPSVEETLAEFRRLKKSDARPVQSSPARVRQNFFLKLPRESRIKAAQVLENHDMGLITPEETVAEMFRSLGIRYAVKPFTASNSHLFHLVDDVHDCVIMGRVDTLYTRVVDHMKVMLNYQFISSSSSENSLDA